MNLRTYGEPRNKDLVGGAGDHVPARGRHILYKRKHRDLNKDKRKSKKGRLKTELIQYMNVNTIFGR